jgi:hypothetical protein
MVKASDDKRLVLIPSAGCGGAFSSFSFFQLGTLTQEALLFVSGAFFLFSVLFSRSAKSALDVLFASVAF